MGWTGSSNGDLLRLASAHGFDALVTVDRGIEYQQNQAYLTIPVITDCTDSSTHPVYTDCRRRTDCSDSPDHKGIWRVPFPTR